MPVTTPPREALLRVLPYARRYARALTGAQTSGDAAVADALRTLSAEGQWAGDPRILLYRQVTGRIAGQALAPADGHILPVHARALLLLTTVEDMSLSAAASVLAIPEAEAETMLEDARARLRAAVAAEVLIIEDEPIIALDLEELVKTCGHRVVGVANTEAEAVALAAEKKPGLILADINLGAGGDGTSAVATILRAHQAPVIFVTAYPERLLTGQSLEPAFVITKPFEPLTLAIATYQAVVGGEPLHRL